jgi:alpha-beta hydrolase superfamily lysophospholipase
MAFFQSTDGTQLHEEVWLPQNGQAQALVVIVHGYGEHIGRYEQTARELTRAGLRVHGYDQRGHGQSGGVRGFCRRFDEFLTDLGQILHRARAAGDLPLFQLGPSFGGLVAAHYALGHASELRGLILTSPFFGLALKVPPAKIFAGKIASRLVPTLALPSGLKGSDVSRDPEVGAAYDRDPLNNKNATARWFTETSAAQDSLFARASELRLPTLVMQGEADRIADARRTQAVFERIGSADKTFHMLTGQFHEVLNELPADRQKTLADIISWIAAHQRDSRQKLQESRA